MFSEICEILLIYGYGMFWDKFVSLCVQHNTKPNPVAAALGISSGAVTKWKQGAEPNSTTLRKIANYFGVSVDYLLGHEEKEKPAANDGSGLLEKELDQELIRLLCQLDSEQDIARVKDYVRLLKEAHKD